MRPIPTTNPILLARRMVRVLAIDGRPYVRPIGPGYYLTGFDSLGCIVWAPCDVNGEPRDSYPF